MGTSNVEMDTQPRPVLHGRACTAGGRGGRARPDVSAIAEYFSVSPDRLERVLTNLETGDQPQIAILQNTAPGAKVAAVAFFSSVWSRSYANVGTPYGKVHRDFHYQCLFSAIAALVEVGCESIRVEPPMSGHLWRRDAYICLLEVVRNIQKNMNRRAMVHLELGPRTDGRDAGSRARCSRYTGA